MSEHNEEISTVRMSKKAKKAIEELGSYSDTHEAIIMRLAEHYKKCKKMNGVKQ